jgi:hypothetical protein
VVDEPTPVHTYRGRVGWLAALIPAVAILPVVILALGRGSFHRAALIIFVPVVVGGAAVNLVTGHWPVGVLWLANVAMYLPLLLRSFTRPPTAHE